MWRNSSVIGALTSSHNLLVKSRPDLNFFSRILHLSILQHCIVTSLSQTQTSPEDWLDFFHSFTFFLSKPNDTFSSIYPKLVKDHVHAPITLLFLHMICPSLSRAFTPLQPSPNQIQNQIPIQSNSSKQNVYSFIESSIVEEVGSLDSSFVPLEKITNLKGLIPMNIPAQRMLCSILSLLTPSQHPWLESFSTLLHHVQTETGRQLLLSSNWASYLSPKQGQGQGNPLLFTLL